MRSAWTGRWATSVTKAENKNAAPWERRHHQRGCSSSARSRLEGGVTRQSKQSWQPCAVLLSSAARPMRVATPSA